MLTSSSRKPPAKRSVEPEGRLRYTNVSFLTFLGPTV